MSTIVETERVLVREWSTADAEAAFAIFGAEEVARWLAPAMPRVTQLKSMQPVLTSWIQAGRDLVMPAGHWAIVEKGSDAVVGSLAIRFLPPYGEDLELGCQLAPSAWGHGYATEASHALMHWAFQAGAIDEIYMVSRPGNQRAAAAAKRLGLEWVGETDKYYELTLQIYRMRASELDVAGLCSPGLSVRSVRAAGLFTKPGSSPIGHASQDGSPSS